MMLIYSLISMKKTKSSGRLSKRSALNVLWQKFVLLLESLKKSMASGEGFTWKRVKSPENSLDIRVGKTGLTPGNI